MTKDYRIYEFGKKEKYRTFFEGMILNFVISYLFYDSLWAMIPGIAVVFLYFREKKRFLMQKRMRRMRVELKIFFQAFITALQTGRSIENAFAQAMKDLTEYLEKDTELLLELKRICVGVSVGESLETLLLDFAERSHLEELEYFAEVFSIAKRSGGNLISIMKNTIRMLQERMNVEEEIYTAISETRVEFYLMCVIPFGIIVYLRMGIVGLLKSLYGNVSGIVVMTLCLGIYGGCYFYGKKILEFET